MDFMYDYEGVEPKEWTPLNVEVVCLDIVPRKITAEIETFENYGDILIQFLTFLGSKNYISNSKELIEKVEEIKEEIALEAENPENLGMAKSFMMSTGEESFEFVDEEEIKNFMRLQQLEASNQMMTPLREDPYQGIGRNQKITVKYEDGKIAENIKFKKVEKDLRDGRCEIIKK
jgi:hypothetical protein